MKLYRVLDSTSLKNSFEEYYLRGGCETRYTDFLYGAEYEDLFDLLLDIMTNYWIEHVWPLYKVDEEGNPTTEKLELTENQLEAICKCFADYVWTRYLQEQS